jgi:1,5-anhydro-D-fructose reductase (1,5-anhydro-D-mannitol-forming)
LDLPTKFTADVLKLAIIGFGHLARRYYVPALKRVDGVQVVAVGDPLEASLAAAKNAFPRATLYPDHSDLLEREGIDALVVASPPSTHLAIWNAAAGRNLPTFVEKPFVLCDELPRADRSPAARPLLMPDFNRRFWPSYRALREICLGGRIGNIESAEFVLRVNLERWSSVTNHRRSLNEGSALYDLGSSQLDLIEYLLGDRIADLRAQIKTVKWPSDHVWLAANLASGIRVNCEIGYASKNRESIEITGSIGAVKIRNPNGRILLRAHDSGTMPLRGYLGDTITLAYRAVRRDQSMLRYTIRASLAEFVAAISERRPFSPNFADAIENARCLEAATQSAKQKRFVEVIRTENPGDARRD